MPNNLAISVDDAGEDGVMRRVEYDDVEFDDQLALVGGEPFSGVIYSMHPNGQLESESLYVEGLPDGLQQEWYANGQLEKRAIAIRGKGSSSSQYWYPDGKPKSYRRDIDQWPVEIKEWDEQGRLVIDEQRAVPN